MRKRLILLMLIPAVMLGESYWQQEVKYNIEATLDPGKQTITGTETLVYKNNSPDVLSVVYFRLYWNLFTKGSYGEEYSIRNKQYYSMPESGIRLDKFTVIENDGELLTEYTIDNTLMEVRLPKPLRPGESVKFSIGWVGKIPEGGYRTGRQGKDYNIAQWYPQIATYDKHGWDKSQYLGPAEFYNEYGSFDVKLSIPKSYTLGYSGWLLNPEEVYPDSVLTRLKDSEGNPETIRIADYSGTKWNDADTALVTWKFQAENVRDFAFSANEHYIWDVAHWSPGPGSADIAIHALYFPDKAEFWKNTAKYGQHTISFLSRHFGQYAYPNCFIVEGVVGGGMEYPGITFIGHYGDKEYHSPFGVVTHEVAHNWYPMMVGSDETYYAFMDEGFTTFLTALATEDYFGRHDNSFEWSEWYQRFFAFPNSDERQGIQNNYFWLAKSGAEEPICTHTYRFEQGQAGTSIYSKTAAVLFMLQYLLGDSTFESAMNLYFDRWKFKHPYPEDFYQTMEEAGGNRDLRWFFDQWINRTDRCDYGISDFDYERVSRDGVSFYRATVSVRRYQSAVMPVDVEVTMDDGSKETVWFPIDKWLNAEVERDTVIDLPRMPVKAEINPDGRILDINRLNNRYPLPKFAVNFDNTLFGVTPVDAYLIKWRPSVWFTDRGGWNLGYKVRGGYLDDLAAVSIWNAYNTRDNSFNYDLNISHNSYRITPMSEISLRYYRMEGRSGASLSLQKQLRRNFSVPPSHTLRFTYSFSRVDDQSYLWIPESWEKGNLHRAVFGYDYSNRGSFWDVNASAQLEGSSSLFGRSYFQYSKRTFRLRTNINIPGGWDLNLRYYNGIGYGEIPNQAKYYFSSSSPLEQLGEPLLRSKGILPGELRKHTLSPGGGFMRGYHKVAASGDKIDAVNLEARFSTMIPFLDVQIPILNYIMNRVNSSVFCDAGRIAAQSQKLWDQRFETDLGFGFRLTSFRSVLGDFASSDLLSSIGLNTIRIDFPLYVSLPPEGESKLKWRWILSFNRNF